MRLEMGYAAAFMSAAIGACAKPSDQVTAAYMSPFQYESYSCQQLADEAQRLSARAAAVGTQDQKASNDAVMLTEGIVVVWPTVPAIGSNDQNAYELARIRGEMEAVEQISIRKNCRIRFHRIAPADDPMVVTAQPQPSR